MIFKDLQCVACGKEFTENDDVVVCPECGSPHHRECWNSVKHCFNEEKHSQGYIWEMPEEKRRPVESIRPNRTSAIDLGYKFKNGEALVACPHCKAPNFEKDAFCLKCGKSLTVQSDTSILTAANGKDAEKSRNYESNKKYGGIREDACFSNIKAKDYSTVIGGRSPGNFIRKIATMERFDRKFSFSPIAFILGPIWFFYRKLFKEGLLFSLAIIGIAIIQAICLNTDYTRTYAEKYIAFIDEIQGKEYSYEEAEAKMNGFLSEMAEIEVSVKERVMLKISSVCLYINITLLFVMALTATYFYKKKLVKIINEVYEKGKNEEEIENMLISRRTIFPLGIFIGLLVYLLRAVISISPFIFFLM